MEERWKAQMSQINNSMVNNVVNRMSAWAHWVSRDKADEDGQLLAEDLVKLLDVVRTSNEYFLAVERAEKETGKNDYSEQRVQLIAALKAVAEHRVEILRPDSPSGKIII